MAVTASTMILKALRLLGEKGPGDTLTTAEQTDYLYDLNSMMDSWQTERLLVYQILTSTFSLSSGVSSYTIGSGGTFNIVRPLKIEGALVRNANYADSGVEIVGPDAWRRIVIKTNNGNSYPEYLYYDNADAAGLGTVYLYPQPQAGLTLVLDTWQVLQAFSTVSTTLTLPPGYQRAIEYNFAIEVAGGSYQPSDATVKIARESKANIKKLNVPDMSMTLPVGLIQAPRRSRIFAGP
jgi:hypothetical protein